MRYLVAQQCHVALTQKLMQPVSLYHRHLSVWHLLFADLFSPYLRILLEACRIILQNLWEDDTGRVSYTHYTTDSVIYLSYLGRMIALKKCLETFIPVKSDNTEKM
jgi:hypothetical protein